MPNVEAREVPASPVTETGPFDRATGDDALSQAMLRILERVTGTNTGDVGRGPGIFGVATNMAEYWLDATERIMDDIDCTSEQKLKGAVSLLRDEAYQWWLTRQQDFTALVEKVKISEDVKRSERQNFRAGVPIARPQSCADCGRHHLGECWKKIRACFRCGSREHQVKDCPQRPVQLQAAGQGFVQPMRGGQQPPRGHGRAKGGKGVGRGRTAQGRGAGNIKNVPYTTLNDLGSMHSYIACTVSGTLGIMCQSTVNEMIVLSPLGQSVRVDRLFKYVPLEVQGVIFPADLMELPFGEFDLILGMDWLVKHRASLYCAAKCMVLKTTEDEEVAVIGEQRDFLSNVISALRAEKLVRKGFEVFLAYVGVSDSEGPSVGDIRTVLDFSDVFPDELSRLLSNREFEFSIELLPGAATVSTTPYRMAPKSWWS
ncbi:uncharacterized protein [Gossypium hirsutum]|uniref:CCHC-type domain-containing protein n=1 Tax=Gossypium hirsutum TaxID=3635 RepID=A0ABM3AM34_GOSHI|nr:uncharacterized protein LOC121220306 [Gossypium hirsutum]